MKAVFISYNQAYHEEIMEIMRNCGLKGYTYWDVTKGRGSFTGEPHLGDHAWPTLNGSLLIMAQDNLVPEFKKRLKALDSVSEAMGLRYFTWTVDED